MFVHIFNSDIEPARSANRDQTKTDFSMLEQDPHGQGLHTESELIISHEFQHPFDSPDLQRFLLENFSEYSNSISNMTRQKLSPNPTKLEVFEAAAIQKRRMTKNEAESDDPWRYFERVLYTDCFSLNQFGDQEIKLSPETTPGFTPGGLVSHFYKDLTPNGLSIPTIIKNIPESSTLREGIARVLQSSLNQDTKQHLLKSSIEIIEATEALSTRNDAANENSPGYRLLNIKFISRVGHPSHFDKIITRNIDYQKIYPELDLVGYRLLQMLKHEPAMVNSVIDNQLKQQIGMPESIEVSLARLFVESWRYFSAQLYTGDFGAQMYSLERRREILEKLLYFRTHPELQVLFRYFSPSAYFAQSHDVAKTDM